MSREGREIGTLVRRARLLFVVSVRWRDVHSPRSRPMISFMISVVPP